MGHTYEEIRNVVIDILIGREKVNYSPDQYEHLLIGLLKYFNEEKAYRILLRCFETEPRPSSEDAELAREIFWDLFRQGIITLGSDNANREFPHFKVSSFGTKVLHNQNPYFFHDLDSYTKIIQSNVPNINDITLLYLQEAMQSFKSGCMLASTVMLGVASEHSFLLLVETAETNPIYGQHFTTVSKERTILQKFRKFRAAFENNSQANLPNDIKEGLDVEFNGILFVIRTFRNESGHPSGKFLEREQTYVLLQMFIPYCKKIYQLIDFFK